MNDIHYEIWLWWRDPETKAYVSSRHRRMFNDKKEAEDCVEKIKRRKIETINSWHGVTIHTCDVIDIYVVECRW